jgi:hypothetical protein
MHFGGKERLADADLEAAAKTIRESLEAELTEHELRRVDQGLNQSSKSGERRYIGMPDTRACLRAVRSADQPAGSNPLLYRFRYAGARTAGLRSRDR